MVRNLNPATCQPRTNAAPPPGPKGITPKIQKKKKAPVKRYSYDVCMENFASECETVEDLVKVLRREADRFEAMDKDGIEFEAGDPEEGYFVFRTTDDALAEKHGLDEDDEDDDDHEDDEEEDEEEDGGEAD